LELRIVASSSVKLKVPGERSTLRVNTVRCAWFRVFWEFDPVSNPLGEPHGREECRVDSTAESIAEGLIQRQEAVHLERDVRSVMLLVGLAGADELRRPMLQEILDDQVQGGGAGRKRSVVLAIQRLESGVRSSVLEALDQTDGVVATGQHVAPQPG